MYLGCDSCKHIPLLFKVTIKYDDINGTNYLLLSGVDKEQLRVEDFLDKVNLPCITRSVLAKRSALRLHSFVLSNNNSIECAFDILTDTIHLPNGMTFKPTEYGYPFVSLECIATKLKSLIGDVNRSDFTHTNSYDEDINSYIDFINQAREFIMEPSDFNFYYIISLQRDAQV